MTETNNQYNYKKQSYKKLMFIIIGLIICAVSFVTDIIVGPASLTLSDVWLALTDPSEVSKNAYVIIWSIRLPTAIMALLVGASLGIAGAGMQTILDNPLSSPYTLGISAGGAGFGASLMVVVGASALEFLGVFMVPFGAFVFASLTSFFIYSINKIKNFSSETMILAGIGMMFLFQALQSLMQYMASPEALQNIVFWTMGSLAKANWINISIVLLVLVIMLPLMMRESWRLTALKLGDEKASGLGVDVESLRVKVFAFISLITAVAVSFVGTIGFIGIVGPHIARMLVGEDQRYFLPLSAVCGMAILSLASIASKMLVPGGDVPNRYCDSNHRRTFLLLVGIN
ncbi:FecCD family ABC transporter permease [Veillonella rogosae]|uniref:FecCD family ABC transporter permease n=1 Tax=Veillonella rogosae TaxID=423477 RepID=UPI000A6340CA|nr:iron ABC transporter permease [Veillonella rogosae]